MKQGKRHYVQNFSVGRKPIDHMWSSVFFHSELLRCGVLWVGKECKVKYLSGMRVHARFGVLCCSFC